MNAHTLVANAVTQFAVSSLLGFAMLLPRQPWFRYQWSIRQKELLAAHLDWIMLGLVQGVAAVALGMIQYPGVAWQRAVVGLLLFGGWINPVPYLLRGMGIDAFVLAGSRVQRLSALLSGTSSMALLVAFVMLAVRLW